MNDIESDHMKTDQSQERASQVIFLLMDVAQSIQERMERGLESVELSSAKFAPLSVLAEAGKPLSLGELAERVRCVRSNMTQLVDRLESDGLVRRTNDPSDRRVVRAELTPLGMARAEAGAEQVAKVQGEFADMLSEKDRQVLGDILAAIR